MDLSAMRGERRAVAIDTKKDYAEIDLGELECAEQRWKGLYESDWVIAVGEFEGE